MNKRFHITRPGLQTEADWQSRARASGGWGVGAPQVADYCWDMAKYFLFFFFYIHTHGEEIESFNLPRKQLSRAPPRPLLPVAPEGDIRRRRENEKAEMSHLKLLGLFRDASSGCISHRGWGREAENGRAWPPQKRPAATHQRGPRVAAQTGRGLSIQPPTPVILINNVPPVKLI